MLKNKSPRNPETKWVYFVFNWGSPVGCFTNAVNALALCKLLSKKWGNPIPEGALVVKRFAPALGFYKAKEQDLTEMFLRNLN